MNDLVYDPQKGDVDININKIYYILKQILDPCDIFDLYELHIAQLDVASVIRGKSNIYDSSYVLFTLILESKSINVHVTLIGFMM